MTCIQKIYSLSVLVGNGECNGRCEFCAGAYLRSQAKENTNNKNFEKNLESAIKLCSRYGGWSLSLTSAGEPTCDPEAVTRALQVYDKCAKQGAYMPNVNLFTNGILLGDKSFAADWLPEWKSLGLTNVAVSVHSVEREKQAFAYGIDCNKYPCFHRLFNTIREHGLGVRCTLLLRKGEVDNAESYARAIEKLYFYGCDNVTSWPIGNPDGSRNAFTPSQWGLFTIKKWLWFNTTTCHEHAWSGGVYDHKGNMLRLTDYVTKHDPKKDYVRQLVVFPDGCVTYSWVTHGALCMK